MKVKVCNPITGRYFVQGEGFCGDYWDATPCDDAMLAVVHTTWANCQDIPCNLQTRLTALPAHENGVPYTDDLAETLRTLGMFLVTAEGEPWCHSHELLQWYANEIAMLVGADEPGFELHYVIQMTWPEPVSVDGDF